MNLIVFLIHRIQKSPSSFEVVSEELFKNIVYLAKDLDFSVIELKETLKSLEEKTASKYLSFTFDDGWESDYKIALPVLLENNLKATFFITTNMVGQKKFMSWSQIRELSQYGMEIGSHTKSHPFLTKIPLKEAHIELQESKKELEEKLGREIVALSIPGGEYNKNILNIAREVGYKTIAISKPGINRFSSDVINRISLHQGFTKDNIKEILKLSDLMFFRLQGSYFARSVLKKILGIEAYTKFRNLILKRKQI